MDRSCDYNSSTECRLSLGSPPLKTQKIKHTLLEGMHQNWAAKRSKGLFNEHVVKW